MSTKPPTLAAANVALLCLDVDGVLTDGSIYITAAGDEIKRYHVADGFALRLCAKAGLPVAVITGRTSNSLLHRLADLEIPHVIQGSKHKASSLKIITERTGIRPEHICHIGDDWPDLPILLNVGFPVAVANAASEVKAAAAYTTTAPGGHGAVREVVNMILNAKGVYETLLAEYGGR